MPGTVNTAPRASSEGSSELLAYTGWATTAVAYCHGYIEATVRVRMFVGTVQVCEPVPVVFTVAFKNWSPLKKEKFPVASEALFFYILLWNCIERA